MVKQEEVRSNLKKLTAAGLNTVLVKLIKDAGKEGIEVSCSDLDSIGSNEGLKVHYDPEADVFRISAVIFERKPGPSAGSVILPSRRLIIPP